MDAPVTVAATLTLDAAAATSWDAIVIGAGPAGAVAAHELARRGVKTLLVDKASFPRAKICGCCLNGAALSALEAAGLGDLPRRLGAMPLTRVRLAAGKKSAEIRWPSGVTFSREAFDAALVQAALAAGAEFLPETAAKLVADDLASDAPLSLQLRKERCFPSDSEVACPGQRRGHVDGRSSANVKATAARVAIVAAGLNARLAPSEEIGAAPMAGSRIGAGVILDRTASDLESGTVSMAVGRGGYVGMVRLEDGRLDVAAAFDAPFVRASGGLGGAAAVTLEEAGFPVPNHLETAPWRGTPALTRSAKQVAGVRWFAVGDAAGYVEPFTGEGIAWALTSGAAVAPLAAAAVAEGSPLLARDWEKTYRRLIRSRQGTCRTAAAVLRSPRLTRWAVRVLALAPALSIPVTRALHRPTPLRLRSLA